MPQADTHGSDERQPTRRDHVDLIPREFLRIIAVWSLIPAYLLAGAFVGWVVDHWLGTWPWGLCIGLVIALGLAVRDMLRLRDSL
jgi:hypothetical protein